MFNLRKLKKDKLVVEFLGPLIFSIILIVWYYLTNLSCVVQNFPLISMSESKFVLWVDTLGLLLITFGAILAIRPLIRNLLNPKIKLEETRIKRDRNAGLMAFVYIFVGFALQFTSKIYYLIDSPIYFLNGSAWPIISLAITFIAYSFIIKRYREFKVI